MQKGCKIRIRSYSDEVKETKPVASSMFDIIEHTGDKRERQLVASSTQSKPLILFIASYNIIEELMVMGKA